MIEMSQMAIRAEFEPSACAREREKGICIAMGTDIYSVFNPPKKIELRPCPFCGEEEKVKLESFSDDDGSTIVIDSEEELESNMVAFVHCYGCDMDYFPHTDKPLEVMEAWNNRAYQQHEVEES